MMTSGGNEDVDFIDFTINPDNFVFESPGASSNLNPVKSESQSQDSDKNHVTSTPIPSIAISKASIIQKLVPSASISSASNNSAMSFISTRSPIATPISSFSLPSFQRPLLRSPLLSRTYAPPMVTNSTATHSTSLQISSDTSDGDFNVDKPFWCHMCSKKFKRSCDLDRHLVSHSEARPFKCNTCGAEYKYYRMLEQHQLMSHPLVNIFPCGQCGQSFASEMKLKRHKVLVHKKFNLVFKCGKCDSSFSDVNELKIHFDIDHSADESLELQTIVIPAEDINSSQNSSQNNYSNVSHSFNHSSQMDSVEDNGDARTSPMHLEASAMHTNDDGAGAMDVFDETEIKPDPDFLNSEQQFRCNKCDAIFVSQQELARHLQLSCKFCHKLFNTMSQLAQHVLLHTNEKLFKCFKCGRTFKEKVWLDRHLKYGHIVKKVAYSCNICSKIFNDVNVLKLHRLVHQNEVKDEDKNSFVIHSNNFLLLEPSAPVSQPSNGECSTSSANQTSSIWHLHNTSPVTVDNILMPPVRCDKCDMVFDDMSELADHRANHHNDELKLSCPHCEATFTRNNDLKRHLLRHTDVRPFKCPECDKAYKTSYHLRDHMLVHGDAKAFACELCDKTFKRRDQLRSHIYYRHSNNRVYSCPVCYKTSHSTYHFKMHMLTHSNVRPFRCDQCGKTFKAETQLDAHQIVHSTVKPFVCQICGDSYKYKYQLHKHERSLHGIFHE